MVFRRLTYLLSLTLITVITGCHTSGTKKGSTLSYPAKKVSKSASVNITYLTYNSSTGSGGTHKARITVSPNSDNELNIGISGNLSGGLGGQWRAAVWIASMQAALAVGRDLDEYAINVRGQGYIDGPSAGALFTAGIIAAMTGTPVLDNVTMTGTVNPDGSVGPVGGIPNKFIAAIKDGKTILGYPVGQRFNADLKTGKIVDLQQLALKNNAQAVEMSTVYDAFKLLTGKELPKPEPIDSKSMELSIEMINLLRKKAGSWNQYYLKYSTKFQEQKLQYAPGASRKLSVAKKYIDKAVDLLREGSMASAYDFSQRGGGNSFSSFWYGMFYKILFLSKDPAVLDAALQKNLISPMVSDLGKGLSYLKKAKPTTVGDLIAMISAYEQMIGSFGYMYDASTKSGVVKKLMPVYKKALAEKKNVKGIVGYIIRYLRSATYRYNLARLKFEKALDFLEFKTLSRKPVKINEDRVKKIAKTIISSAQANLNYINEVLLTEYSKKYNKTMKDTQDLYMDYSNNYLQAFYSLKIPENLIRKNWGEKSIATYYAQIAGSMGSYFASSMFLVKHYGLGVNKNSDGNIESVKMQKSLVHMLKHAELNSRIHAARALKLVGEVPPSAKIFYNIGNTMKEMDIALKIKALEMYWRASLECQLAISLTRN
ncbi:MAG: hypothetical protein JXR95_00475 [Deltaproteobacteria bacterium]|nr:hypothetical protein [Deltaproteobacteria bacterium]